MPNSELLHKTLVERKLYSKDYTAFQQQFDTPDKQEMLRQELVKRKLYSKDSTAFQQQFFNGQEQPLSELLDAQPVEQQEQKTIKPTTPGLFADVEKGQTQETPLSEQVNEPASYKSRKMGRAESATAVFVQRFFGLPGEISKAIAIGGNAIDRYVLGQDVKAEDNPLYKAGQWYEDAIKELSPSNPEYQGELQESVAQAMGDLASLVIGGGAARMAGKGVAKLTGKAAVSEAAQMFPGAAKLAGKPLVNATAEASKNIMKGIASPEGLIGATQMGVSEFEQAIDGGATEDEAFDIFIKNASIGSVLERIPVQLFWKRLDTVTGGGVKTLLKKGFSGGMEEATTEILQQAYANKKASEVYDTTRSILDGMGESGGIGFGLGFVLNAMGVRLRSMKKNVSKKEAKAIQKTIDMVDQEIATLEKTIEETEKLQKDAIKEGEVTEDNQQQYPETKEGGEATETGDSNIPEQSGEVQEEVQTEEQIQPEQEVTEEPISVSGDYDVVTGNAVFTDGNKVTKFVKIGNEWIDPTFIGDDVVTGMPVYELSNLDKLQDRLADIKFDRIEAQGILDESIISEMKKAEAFLEKRIEIANKLTQDPVVEEIVPDEQTPVEPEETPTEPVKKAEIKELSPSDKLFKRGQEIQKRASEIKEKYHTKQGKFKKDTPRGILEESKKLSDEFNKVNEEYSNLMKEGRNPGPYAKKVMDLSEKDQNFQKSPTQENYDDLIQSETDFFLSGETGTPESPANQVEFINRLKEINKQAKNLNKVDPEAYVEGEYQKLVGKEVPKEQPTQTKKETKKEKPTESKKLPIANETVVKYEYNGRTYRDAPIKVDPNGDLYFDRFGTTQKVKAGNYEIIPDTKSKKNQDDGPYDSGVVVSSGFGGVQSIDTSKKLSQDKKSDTGFLQEYFTPRGNLPREVFQISNDAKGRINKIIQKVNFIHADFNKALSKVYGKTKLGVPKINQAELTKINDVLSKLGTDTSNREKVLSGIDPKLRDVVLDMRNHIDQLSQELKQSGLIQGDLEGKIDENLGYYLTRTYRVHKDPNWKWQNIPDSIKNRAFSVVKSMNPEMSFEEIDGLMKSWVNNPEVTWGFAKQGIASKDLGILKNRKNIDKAIRDLLGEYNDPFYNYATSISKMANLIENHYMLTHIKNIGERQGWLFDKPNGEYHVPIAGKGSQTKSPLNGLYTTKELAKAINQFNETEPLPTWLRYYMKVNSLVKYGKTILSPMTHSRNFISNGALQLANGRFGLSEGAETFKNIYNVITSKKDAEFRNYIERLNELGVINDTVLTGELQDTMKDAVEYFEDFDRYGDSSFKKAFRKVRRASERAYQIEDDVHKMYAFEIEKSRYEDVYKKKYPEKSDEAINYMAEKQAAKIVRMTMPTYSLVPKAIKYLRRWPITGSFVSFPAEILRVSYNTQRLWWSELRDPSTRTIGLKRAMGSMMAATFTSAAATFRQIALGMDDDEDDRFKRFLPPWSKNSDIIMIDKKGRGIYTYMDFGFSDPHNYIKKPINASEGLFKKNTSKKQVLLDAVTELFEPFLGEEILMSRLLDVSRNKKKGSGLPVYNESLEIGDQIKDVTQYMTEGLEPGAISSIRRIRKSFKKNLGDYGQSSTPTDEILNVVLGQKIQTLDVGFNYKYKLRKTGDQIKDAVSVYSWQLKKKYGSTKEEKNEAYRKSSESLKRIIDEAQEDYKAALKLGVSVDQLEERINDMYVGPYKANKTIKEAISKGKRIMIDRETGKVVFP
jgi:hypothetical protein